MEPKVSVVMSTYNRDRAEGSCPSLLKRALDSILSQTMKDFELILIDDGSTDNTKAVCDEYAQKDKRILFYHFEENSGVPAKRYNDGILLTTTPYITFMFDDDKWYSNALSYLYKAITEDHKDAGMVYGLTNYMNVKTGQPLALNFGEEWSWELIDQRNFLCNNSVITKRDVIDDVGGYDEDLIMRRLCDWDLWWRIGRKYKVERIIKVIGEVHAFHEDSIGVNIDYDYDAIKKRQYSDRKVRLQGELKKKLSFSFVHHGHDAALQRWRIWYLADALRRKGHSADIVHMNHHLFTNKCLNSDVIVFYRCYFKKNNFINELVRLGKLVIYDIDDFVFQKHGRFNSDMERQLINNYISAVNCYTASTPTLLKQIPINKKPRYVRRNAIDERTYSLLSSYNKKPNKRFRIGWLAGINRNEMHFFMKEFIRNLNASLPNVEFWYFGKMDSFYRYAKTMKNISVNRLTYVPTANWKDFYKRIQSANLDVVINPLVEDNVFFNCKSELKYIECGALGIPLITSRVKPFTEVIKEKETGLFATSALEFVMKIIKLKNDHSLRQNIIDNARKDTRERYIIDNNIEEYINFAYYSLLQYRSQPLFKSQTPQYKVDLRSENFGFVTPEIKTTLRHKFRSLTPGLCRIEYLGSTQNKQFDTIYRVTLRNIDVNRIIFEKTYNTRDFKHNAWWGFEFPPLPDSEKTNYELEMTPITVDTYGVQLFMNLTDNPMYGKFSIGEQNKTGVLAFRSYASTQIHTMPQNKKPVLKEHKDNVSVYDLSSEQKNDQEVNVLLTRKGTIGEVLFLTPIIEWLSKNKNCKIYVATNHKHVFANNPFVDGLYNSDEKVSNIGQRFNLNDIYENNAKLHPIDAFARVVVGHSNFDKSIKIYSNDSDKEFLDDLMAEYKIEKNNYVVLHKGVTAKNRTMPEDVWTRLEAFLLSKKINVVVVGQGSDFGAKMKGAIDVTNKLSIQQSKELIANSNKFIGVDSDYLQVAGSTNTPIVSIHFSTRPELRWPYRNGKLGDLCKAVHPAINCFGCWHLQTIPKNYFGCHKKNFLCHRFITPKQIYEAMC